MIDVRAAVDPLREMDYRSVGRHNSARSAYVVYADLVYDITEFLGRHPGGSAILGAALGTDITDILDTYHDVHVSRLLQSPAFRERNGIRLAAKLAPGPEAGNSLVGLHDYQSRRRYPRADDMAIELRKEVTDFLRRTGLPPRKRRGECLLLLTMFYASYGIGIFMAFIVGSPLWCLLLGPMTTFMMVNVAHTALHGGFSDSRLLNLVGQCLFDACGYAACRWNVDHQSHHQAPHSSVDLQTAPPTGMRFFENQAPRWFHRHQMIYLWLVLAVYAPSSWITYSYDTLFRYPSRPVEKILHVGFKLIFFVLPIASTFVRFDLAHALGNFFLFIVSMSYSSVFMLFIQHGDSYLPEDQSDPWSVRQVSTSVSWRCKSRVFEWLFGYFNYHIEHHLFPGLNPALYPKIQPIVKAICAKYGVRYKDISYAELVGSQLGAWRAYAAGRHPSLEAVG